MEAEYFKKVKDALPQKNTLTVLTEYNALLSKIAEKLVYEIERPNGLGEIMSIIKIQKKICEIAENLYESLQKENLDTEVAKQQLDALESACKEHDEQYEKYTKECENEKESDDKDFY